MPTVLLAITALLHSTLNIMDPIS